MKSATTVRRVGLSFFGVFISVAMVALGLQTAFSKPAVAPPTITSQPANPAASTSATFKFTGPAGATFQCKLDAAAFAACASPTTYTGLAQNSHTFQVKALVGADQSSATSYAWTVDSLSPPVPTIAVKPALLSNTTSPFFSFTDTESSVTFRCQLDALTWTACVSPSVYSGLAQGGHNFGVQAVDAAGNSSGWTTWTWSIDSIAPASPVLTTKPTDPTSTATNTFEWTWPGSEPGIAIQCSVENGPWAACSSPYTYFIATTNNQQHQFAVRAIDATGNASVASYQFKYVQGLPTSGLPFKITGSVSGLTLGTYKPILVTITNPNSVTIFVSALNVAVPADSVPAGCTSADNVDLAQSNVSTSLTIAVPANGSVVLPAQGATAPLIRLKNLPTVNQDVCKNKSFALTYSGTATN